MSVENGTGREVFAKPLIALPPGEPRTPRGLIQVAFASGAAEVPLPVVRNKQRRAEKMREWMRDNEEIWMAVRYITDPSATLESLRIYARPDAGHRKGIVSRQAVEGIVLRGLQTLWERSSDSVKANYPHGNVIRLKTKSEVFSARREALRANGHNGKNGKAFEEEIPAEFIQRFEQRCNGDRESALARARLSQTLTGRTLSDEHKENVRRAKTGKKRKPWTDEARARMSEKKKAIAQARRQLKESQAIEQIVVHEVIFIDQAGTESQKSAASSDTRVSHAAG